MTIKKKGKKWATVHCHGKDKGKTISTFDTEKEALAQHRAIQANKSKHKRRKHHSAPEGSFLESRKSKFGVD